MLIDAQLFYAASTIGSRNSGIFYATSATGQPASFKDHGLVLSTNDNDQYNAIDPKYVCWQNQHIAFMSDKIPRSLLITSSGQWYLSWGSFWTGIKQCALFNYSLKPGH